ncbi:hypothetical protein D6Y79_13985 [Escherichia coli]|nr:hypothetical protein [Escherichia coli]EGO8892182.1 hypothetical protein [Escherichia coli]
MPNSPLHNVKALYRRKIFTGDVKQIKCTNAQQKRNNSTGGEKKVRQETHQLLQNQHCGA